MLDRRSFLRRTSLALAGGLVLGPDALEAFERLTHRKIFALGRVPNPAQEFADLYVADLFRVGDWVSVVTGRGDTSYGIVTHSKPGCATVDWWDGKTPHAGAVSTLTRLDASPFAPSRIIKKGFRGYQPPALQSFLS